MGNYVGRPLLLIGGAVRFDNCKGCRRRTWKTGVQRAILLCGALITLWLGVYMPSHLEHGSQGIQQVNWTSKYSLLTPDGYAYGDAPLKMRVSTNAHNVWTGEYQTIDYIHQHHSDDDKTLVRNFRENLKSYNGIALETQTSCLHVHRNTYLEQGNDAGYCLDSLRRREHELLAPP